MAAITLRHRCFITREAIDWYARKSTSNPFAFEMMPMPENGRLIRSQTVVPMHEIQPGVFAMVMDVTEKLG